ncbi:MAG TPA: hypothetical protein VLD59_18780 [Steroidobacteraceae bacterium]|nr:hypothetical protein [Steroidobacteraceae bacterium]
MSKRGKRVRPPASGNGFVNFDARGERWRAWAEGHNRSAEADGSSTFIRRSWIGRLLGAVPGKK